MKGNSGSSNNLSKRKFPRFYGHYALNHVWNNHKWHWYSILAICCGYLDDDLPVSKINLKKSLLVWL